MRTLKMITIEEAVAKLVVEANIYLPQDVKNALNNAFEQESSEAGKEVLRQLIENYKLAEKTKLPLCQDTGLAVFFVELGQDLKIEGNLIEAINRGVRKGYEEGFLRKSACDPFTRKNTGDNTPALIHIELVSGDKLKLNFMAKGGGSENMSRATMLTPAQGFNGIKEFVLKRVAEAGPNPCPPIIVGIGIGGTFDYAPILAKKALFRSLDDVNPDSDLAEKEQELLEAINDLGIGPMGLGGKTTCLGVKIEKHPCHIASLPVAVNIQCHSARHKEVIL
ncbi:fumarate hydratase subunit alpha [Desulfonauticus submarinus]|uniref:Fumarate hydratase subunit alpha n=1 Tax=Desulfonauticus submarinus TaxID=206665 RepID=A0A1H0AGN2_9BACT|nr:fumarate hydratase [Desulfonauticus submarinus]SDN31906.1 fumarate hydratase subunit alpha [Desulfonauticus submarinus]